MGRIGIYGGTFNPIHRGHMEAARQAIRLLKLDKLLLIPAATPPHKVLPEGSPSPEQRLELVRIGSAEEPNIEVSDIELRREGYSYTADTVEQLHKIYSKDRLYLLMGTDMFYSFPSWYEPERICKFVTLAVLLREHENASSGDLLKRKAQEIRDTLHGRVRFVDNQALPMSSSDVRRMLTFQAGQEMLPAGVLEQIQQWGLYESSRNLKNLPTDQLEEKVVSLLDKTRVAHVLGCRDTAVKLAERYGADRENAARAALLHDITKALSPKQQQMLLHAYGIASQSYAGETKKTIHAFTGALVAERIFGENSAVCHAIASHTTGCEGMDTLQKIIYIADYVEPNRNFPGVEALRKLTFEDLDSGVLLGLQMTADLLKQKGLTVAPASARAIEYMINTCKNKKDF